MRLVDGPREGPLLGTSEREHEAPERPSSGSERRRSDDRRGCESGGTDRAGTDRAGTDRAGTDRAGTDRAGTVRDRGRHRRSLGDGQGCPYGSLDSRFRA